MFFFSSSLDLTFFRKILETHLSLSVRIFLCANDEKKANQTSEGVSRALPEAPAAEKQMDRGQTDPARNSSRRDDLNADVDDIVDDESMMIASSSSSPSKLQRYGDVKSVLVEGMDGVW